MRRACSASGRRRAAPQLIADRGAVKEHLRVLRQKADALGPAEALAAQRAAQTGQQAQRRRLAAAVAAEQGSQLAAGKTAAQVLQHVFTVLFIAEPDVPQAEQLPLRRGGACGAERLPAGAARRSPPATAAPSVTVTGHLSAPTEPLTRTGVGMEK